MTDWIPALRAERPDALAELHALLLRAARFELRRRGAGAELDDLAHQCADDALVAVLAKLDDFRGASRFTTWAYKFALLEAAVAMRRLSWRDRELPLAADVPALDDPAATAEEAERLRAAVDAIGRVLTPHQRDVLVALALQDVPIDVLAERRATTRGALYKTLHDARARLRRELTARGLMEARAMAASHGGPGEAA
ncbi:MAG TPA: sigma-70 family RNA polymerase sigma factor [Solirubrobacteraceae bacterium]|jgi:RNA polymerase sigma-70 factor (ECF subfamily)